MKWKYDPGPGTLFPGILGLAALFAGVLWFPLGIIGIGLIVVSLVWTAIEIMRSNS